MVNKKKLLILSGSLFIILIIVVLFLIIKKKTLVDNQNVNFSDQATIYSPEFMSEAEKSQLGLAADSKIQILKKNEAGEAEVYRIIRINEDIVLDLDRIGDERMVQPVEVIK